MTKTTVQLVRLYGGSATDAVLDERTEYFILPSIEGFIPYRETKKARLVLGDPVAPKEEWKELIEAFHQECLDKKVEVAYFLVSEEFKQVCQPRVAIQFGETLFLNPQENPFERPGEHGSLVRRKVRRALSEGVECKEVTDPGRYQEEMEGFAEEWQKGRSGLQVHYSHPNLFKNRQGKRWFIAEKEGELIALVVINRLEAYQGWLLNHLMVGPEVPNGTSEALVISTLGAVASEGATYVTMGQIPTKELKNVEGLGLLGEQISHLLFKMSQQLFPLVGGLETFWSKFEPQREPAYLLFGEKGITLASLKALGKALNI